MVILITIKYVEFTATHRSYDPEKLCPIFEKGEKTQLEVKKPQ